MVRLFLAALRFQEKDLFPYCPDVSFDILALLHHIAPALACNIQGPVISLNCAGCSTGAGVGGADGYAYRWGRI